MSRLWNRKVEGKVLQPASLALQPAKFEAWLPSCVQKAKDKGILTQTGLGLAQREPSSPPQSPSEGHILTHT